MYNYISAPKDAWFGVPDTTQQFLITVNYDNTYEKCDNVCNNRSGSLALFLPEALLTVLDKIEEIHNDCYVRDASTKTCIRLFKYRTPQEVVFSRNCSGKGHCVCWRDTKASHIPTSVLPHFQDGAQMLSMPIERLNYWTMYNLQELYINTNKTSHNNASRFCHDELNSTLVTVLNPLEYLRLLKTMGLKTGIFWIGK